MKKRSAAFLLVATAALAHAGQAKGPLVCPVTRLDIPSAKAAVSKVTLNGKTYYFCTANCRRLFDKNRAKYAKKR